jgi:hypothetical protein
MSSAFFDNTFMPKKSCQPKSTPKRSVNANPVTEADFFAEVEALLKEVTASKEASLNFLKKAGFITRTGKARQFIRG